jgi:hypothetical protein
MKTKARAASSGCDYLCELYGTHLEELPPSLHYFVGASILFSLGFEMPMEEVLSVLDPDCEVEEIAPWLPDALTELGHDARSAQLNLCRQIVSRLCRE